MAKALTDIAKDIYEHAVVESHLVTFQVIIDDHFWIMRNLDSIIGQMEYNDLFDVLVFGELRTLYLTRIKLEQVFKPENSRRLILTFSTIEPDRRTI